MEIDDLNKEIRKCKKCRLYKTRTNALPGEGNLNAKLMLIAQAPGEKEDSAGKMFIGPTGKVLDELLRDINVSRNDIYMTNLVKCILPNYRKPKKDEIDTCIQYLDKEIELINPDTLAPLGYYSIRYIFEKYNLSLPKTKEESSNLYGRIFLTKNRKILPLKHPTALLFNESIREKMINNYRKIKTLLKDCKWYPGCPMNRFSREGKINKRWIQLYCRGDWESCIRYQMEERGEFHPDWMLPDGSFDEKLKNE